MGLGRTGGRTYVELLEHRMLLYARKHDPHGVGPILQEGDLDSVHVIGQLLDVGLQLGKGCGTDRKLS